MYLVEASSPRASREVNDTFMKLGPVHGSGVNGQGMKVAVIDSGIRQEFRTSA
jgi:hypothetical protein